MRLPDLANNSAGCPVRFESQISSVEHRVMIMSQAPKAPLACTAVSVLTQWGMCCRHLLNVSGKEEHACLADGR